MWVSSIYLLLCSPRVYIFICGAHVPTLQSGARINISDASCPERIVTVMGTTDQIVSAFTMISRRFEEVSCVCVCVS